LISDRPSRSESDHYGLFDAVDTTTGKIVWQMKVPQRAVSGVTVAGDLVFLGESNGKFHALNAQSGEVLWTFQSDMAGVGGANGSPAVYMVNGREYVVHAFGGNAQVRSGQPSPTGDTLIAFALPQEGVSEPNFVQANPQQVPLGEIPEANLIAAMPSPPEDARVVTLQMNALHFYPDTFTAQPGEKIAVQLINSSTDMNDHNIAFGFSTGTIGMEGVIPVGQEGYFVFTAPSEPGDYTFWCHVSEHRELGMEGTMTVAASVAQQ
jgi:alcohol dehydrogenase (cytochrome c)